MVSAALFSLAKCLNEAAVIAGDQHAAELIHRQLAKMGNHPVDLLADDQHDIFPQHFGWKLRLSQRTPAFDISNHRLDPVKRQHLWQIIAHDGIELAGEQTRAVFQRVSIVYRHGRLGINIPLARLEASPRGGTGC